jgi:hypothetical protein
MKPEWVAYCHFCALAHTLWSQGDTWQCQRCTFRIPLAHLWWWCDLAEERTIVQELATLTQERMF